MNRVLITRFSLPLLQRLFFIDVLVLVMLFYMKTCAFRGASPRQIHEGLFCLKEPEARYGFSDCGNCALCYPRLESNKPRRKTVAIFHRTHDYRCLNGYRIILNAPAVSVISHSKRES